MKTIYISPVTQVITAQPMTILLSSGGSKNFKIPGELLNYDSGGGNLNFGV